MKKAFLIMMWNILFLAACAGPSSPTNSVGMPAEYAGQVNPLGSDAAAAGSEVYDTNCATCHGPQGHGDGPASSSLDPKPKNLAKLAPTVGDDYLYWRVNTGKEGTSMVAWKGVLTDEQIWQVIVYVRTLK